MQLSINTDYVRDTGDPEPYLRDIADSGFSHVHWCHQWDTDFLYSKWEIKQIKEYLNDYGLHLLDLHASIGREKYWVSPSEYIRLAGVELVKNRIQMTAELGGEVAIIHVPNEPGNSAVRMSLDQIEPFARANGIRLALENGNFDVIQPLLLEYDSDYVGLCYDSGHGNLDRKGLKYFELLKDRLISVHLHDNNGVSDQHMPPFAGTVDWQRLAQIIADSSYTKPMSVEVSMRNTAVMTERDFLKQAFESGIQFTHMINEASTSMGKSITEDNLVEG